MKKFVRSLLAAAALAAGAGALVATAPTYAVAQVAKDPPKTKPADPKADPKVDPKADPKKPADPKPVAAKGTVTIKPGKDGKFRFFVHDEDDKTLMQSSTGYATEEDAKKMLENVKAILASSKVTVEKGEPAKDK